MSELEARFRVRLDGGNEVTDFLAKSSRGATALGSAFKAAGKEIASFGLQTASSLAKMATGDLGIAAQAKRVLELRAAITAVAATAHLGQQDIAGLTTQIHAVAKASNQMQGDLTSALDAFVAKTGKIEVGRKYLELYARTATATGSSVAEIANIGADLDKLKIEDQAKAMAVFAAQADAGAVNLKDLVSQGPRLLAAFAGAGLVGEKGLREGGALAQVFQKGTGNVESTSTAVEATFRDIAKKHGKIEGMGIKVKGRDRAEVLQELIAATGGDEFKLREIFGAQAYRGVQVMATEYRNTKGFGTYEGFKNVAADPALLQKQFDMRNNTAMARLQAAQISIAESMEKNVGPVFERLAKHADVLSRGIEFVTTHLVATGVALAGGLVGWKLLMAKLGGGGGGAGGLTGLLAGKKPIDVNVVSWSGGAPGGGGGTPTPGGGDGKLAAILKSLAVFKTAYEVTRAIDDATGNEMSGAAHDALEGATDRTRKTSALYDTVTETHRMKLARMKHRREGLINEFMGQGMDRGHAINAADQQINNITVVIADGEATVTDAGGTRSAAMLKRRGFDNGSRSGR